MTRLYREPALYERLHRAGTADEARLLVDLFELHGNGGGDWLEPACGTGRLLAALAKKGFKTQGYDLSPEAVAYARKRGVYAEVGDLRTWKKPKTFDAAFCLLGTIRHLMTDKELLAHLKCVAASLRRGGIYIVGLDLTDYDLAEDDEEAWEEHVVVCVAPDRKRRLERVINLVTTPDGVVESSYDLRSYDLSEWRAALAKAPFEVVDEEFFPRLEAPTGTRDALFVLRARP